MTHEEASELLAAYALDAVDEDEHRELEAHVDICPRCRAELDNLREVAGAIGNTVEPLPEGLWSRIVNRLPERPGEGEPPPMPRLATTPSPTPTPTPTTDRPSPRWRGAVVAAAIVAVAAAAVIAALAVGLVRADNRANNLQASTHSAQSSAVRAALATPGHEVVTLDSPTGAALAHFVVVPDGRGYLLSSHLPALPASRTYQLWGIIAGRPISLGLLGPSPRQATFTLSSSVAATALSVTAEPAGGALAPTRPIVATGPV